jgi:hypothetical protein
MIKQCLDASNIDILNFYYSLGSENIEDARQVMRGLLDFTAFEYHAASLNSSSIKFTHSNYSLIWQGIVDAQATLFDRVDLLSSAVSKWIFYFSLTNYNCTINTSTKICVSLDTSNIYDSYFTMFDLAGLTDTYLNMQSFIRSEQLGIAAFLRILDSNADFSPNFIYSESKKALVANRANYRAILSLFNNSIAPFLDYTGQSAQLFNCNNLKRESEILEDFACFRLQVWLWSLSFFSLAMFICCVLMLALLLPFSFVQKNNVSDNFESRAHSFEAAGQSFSNHSLQHSDIFGHSKSNDINQINPVFQQTRNFMIEAPLPNDSEAVFIVESDNKNIL